MRLLASADDESRRQRLSKIRSLNLTQAHEALRILAGMKPEAVDVTLRVIPPATGKHVFGGPGRHKVSLCRSSMSTRC